MVYRLPQVGVDTDAGDVRPFGIKDRRTGNMVRLANLVPGDKIELPGNVATSATAAKPALPYVIPDIPRTIGDWLAITSRRGAALCALGFVGDGASHPLSQRFSSLAAAQAVFPRATALTEEIDGHAIQKFIDEHHSRRPFDPLVVELPDGCYAVSSTTILSGKVATTVRGNNSFITWNKAGIDGWLHGAASTGFQAIEGARFEMKGVNLLCQGVGGTALWVEQFPRTGGFHMDGVRITGSGFQKTNYWNRPVVGIGCGDLLWEGVAIVGSIDGDLSTKSDGVYITYDTTKFPNVQGSFFYRFNNCDVSWYQTGYNILATKTIEGLYIQGGNINSCINAVRYNNTTVDQGGGYPSPQFFIINNQIECYGPYFDLKAVQNVKIKGNLFLVNGPRAGVADPGAFLWDWMSLKQQACDIDVCDNDFTFFDKCSPRYLVNADALGVQNINIAGNKFKWVGEARPGGGVVNFGPTDPTKYNVREWNNVGMSGYYWAFSTGAGARANGNFSQTDIENRVRSQSDVVVGFNCDSGKVSLQGSRLVSITSSSGRYIATFPVEAGVFSSKPTQVIANYGDPFGVVAGETLAYDPNVSTATSLVFQVFNFNPSGAGNRVIAVSASG